MRSYVLPALSILVLVFATTLTGRSDEAHISKPAPLTSNQMLMRDKLVQMNLILEGITLNKFRQVEESAETLRIIIQATSWHIDNPTPQYERFNANFQEQTMDLGRHAKAKNIEAATLDLVRINITCTHCHQHVREVASRGR